MQLVTDTIALVEYHFALVRLSIPAAFPHHFCVKEHQCCPTNLDSMSSYVPPTALCYHWTFRRAPSLALAP